MWVNKIRAILCLCLFMDHVEVLANQLDPSLIPVKEQVLALFKSKYGSLDQWTQDERPKICPLKSLNKAELVTKLKQVAQGLRNNDCKVKHEKLITGMTNMMVQMNSAMLVRQRMSEGFYNDYQGSLLNPDPMRPALGSQVSKPLTASRAVSQKGNVANEGWKHHEQLKCCVGDEECLESFRKGSPFNGC